MLYILPYLERGGTERHVLHLIGRFRNEARVALLSPPGPLLDEFLDLDVVHQAFPRLEHDLLRGVGMFRRGLRRLIAELKPDIIHVHAAPELTVLVRTVTRSIPIVLTLHGFAVANPEGNHKLAGLLSRLGRVQAIIAVSEAEAEMFRTDGQPDHRLRVVYNGIPDMREKPIDWRAALHWSADAPIIGAVGRLERVKGFDLLLQALARLNAVPNGHAGQVGRDRLPRLVIVGDGSEREALERQAAGLGLSDRVHLAGFRDDADRAPGGFDVMALPSRQEALPLACLEAMAAGCPVVASDAGGLPEAVDHARTGYVFPTEDVGGLTDALRMLLADPVRARAMGERGRAKFLKQFHVDTMATRTWAVYEDVTTRV